MSEEIEAVEAADDRLDVLFFGVKIGTANGWDLFGEDGMQFYQFEPEEKFKVLFEKKPDTLAFDWLNGTNLYWELDCAPEHEGIKIDNKKFLELIVGELPCT